MRRVPIPFRVVWPCLAGLLLLGSDCRDLSTLLATFRTDFRTARPGKSSGPRDRYLGVHASRNGGEATFRPAREIHKPFRVEATLGLFDERRTALGAGRFGISLLEPGGVGAFFIASVRRSGDGITVEYRTSGPNPLGTFDVPDAREVDVALESVGGLVILYARRRGDAEYTPVAAAVAPSTGPYQFSIDVQGLPKRAVAGFDLLRVVANGAPASPTPAQQARETVFTAVDALLEAIYALDGPSPDRAAAGATSTAQSRASPPCSKARCRCPRRRRRSCVPRSRRPNASSPA